MFFALDKVSPIGTRPILVALGLVLTVALTWVLTRMQRRHLPPAMARSVFRQQLGVALVAGAATYFVWMQVILPLSYVAGFSMGAFFK